MKWKYVYSETLHKTICGGDDISERGLREYNLVDRKVHNIKLSGMELGHGR